MQTCFGVTLCQPLGGLLKPAPILKALCQVSGKTYKPAGFHKLLTLIEMGDMA